MRDRQWLDKNLRSIMFGVKPMERFAYEDEEMNVIYKRVDSPPSYLVKLVLTLVLGRSPEGGVHKSDWIDAIEFKGEKWVLEDIRGTYWCIYGKEGLEREAESLLKKITAATRVMNAFISEQSKVEIENNNFLLENHFHRINNFYEMYVFETRTLIKEWQDPNESRTISLLFKKRWQYQAKVEANVISSIFFFFSLTEIVLDCCYSLGDRKGLSFKDFRSLSWNERFKRFFYVGDGEVSKLFVELLKIRDEHRNAFGHAEPIYYPFIEGIGWVPRDVSDMNRPIMSIFSSITEEDALRIFDLFEKLMEFIENDSLGKYALFYAKSGLSILINEEQVEGIKQKMTTFDDFAYEIEKRSEYMDALANWDF